ncbi:MAG: DUF1287 domain-containing protein [Verrucomicrobiae bacterium]|nr:DUF1287 domain-containing protein [Verrucomicrobiae bacterium]NNJ87515.1 DUF1287 domain-containing protein [Akkermansiaceae bacterium]
MILLVVVGVGIAARPFISQLLAQDTTVTELKVEETVAWLGQGHGFGNQLAAAALERTRQDITYDDAYYKISYPMGDIPEGKGVCTDVVIRSYRALGIDLQKLVHEDMQQNFRIYPQLWGLKGPDTNIDHRRVPNLQRYLSRFGDEMELPEEGANASSFNFGDVVAWRLPHGATHIGIVVPGPGEQKDEKWVVHNIGSGPRWEDKLLEYQVIGHYRYDGVR